MGKISKRQLAVMDDLFAGQLDEQAILDRHKVSRTLLNKWESDVQFTAEFDNRIASLRRRGDLIIARYSALAAAKLVGLTESEKEETARRACLDIISLLKPAIKRADVATDEPQEQADLPEGLSATMASRLLAALATSGNEADSD